MQKQVFQGFETPSCDLTLLMADGSFCSLLVQVRCSDQLDHCFGLVVVANIDVVFLDKVDGGRESLVLAGASTETFEKQKTATFSSRKVSVIDQLFQILLPMAILLPRHSFGAKCSFTPDAPSSCSRRKARKQLTRMADLYANGHVVSPHGQRSDLVASLPRSLGAASNQPKSLARYSSHLLPLAPSNFAKHLWIVHPFAPKIHIPSYVTDAQYLDDVDPGIQYSEAFSSPSCAVRQRADSGWNHGVLANLPRRRAAERPVSVSSRRPRPL